MTKKILTHLLAIAAILSSLLASASPAQANIFNKFREGFYFEKYSTVEEAKEEILKLHPIGSDADELIKTLEKAGAIIAKEDIENYKKFVEYNEWWEQGTVRIYNVKYDKASPFFVIINYIIWSGSIRADKNNKIISFAIEKRRAY